MPIAALFAVALLQQQAASKPVQSRFQLDAPLPGIPPVMIDEYTAGVGLAMETARAKGLQGRVLWIDGTANLDKVNDEDKIKLLVATIKDAGFNTIIFDVKPISGQTLYPSKIAPKITEWRGQTLPADFDPLAAMVREAKSAGLSIFASLNAFSEGHSMFQVGPGYAKKDWQTVIYEPVPVVSTDSGATYSLPDPANTMSDELGSLGRFTDPSKLPAPQVGQYATILDGENVVVDSVAEGVQTKFPPEFPVGGSILIGTGGAAKYLQIYATPGTKLSFRLAAKYEPISESSDHQYPLMVNPNNPDVQAYELSILREVMRNYPVDGIVYDDRLRYAGIDADFSELTRRLFEQHVGKALNWPDDVFRFTLNSNGAKGIAPGPYYGEWMAWRAHQLKAFLYEARKEMKAFNPNAELGLYAGSWYGEYPALGNNWASPNFDAGFWFLTPNYAKEGLASAVDFFIPGAYYSVPTIYDAMATASPIGASIEAAGTLAVRAVRDQNWVYAGIMLSKFKDNPDGLKAALQAACASTEGVMVFDLSHDIDAFWPVFKEAFAEPKQAPHEVHGLINQIRLMRAKLDKTPHPRDPTVVIPAGSAGTGF